MRYSSLVARYSSLVFLGVISPILLGTWNVARGTWHVAQAQVYTESLGLRLQGGVLYSLHDAAFSSSGDIIDCGQLGSGSGINPVINAIVDFPFSSNIGMGIGIGYAGRSASFSNTASYPIRDSATGAVSTLNTDVTMDATLSYLELQPDLRIALLGDQRHRTLGVIVGPRLCLPLTTEFIQQETITSPADATFIVDGQRTQQRTVAEGPLTTRSSVMFGMSAGVESFIPLSDKVDLVPAVSFDMFFNDVTIDAPWKMYAVRAEIGIRFSAGKTKDTSQPFIAPPPPPPPVIAFAPVSVGILFPAFVGEVVTGNQLRATTPIVNSVFFDSASASIPLNYRRSDDGSVVSTDAVEAHAWLLPRIARIMEQNPDGTIVLEGATSGESTEPAGDALARERAENVKKVLVDLGVESRRITVRSRILPKTPSNSDFAGGREENRRVEILVNNAPLQEWVSAEKFAELRGSVTAQTSRLGGDPGVVTQGIRVKAGNTDTLIKGRAGTIVIPIEQGVETEQTASTLTLEAESDGAMAKRDTVIDLTTLPRRQIELETEEFEAILRFDYNSAELTDDVKGLLRQLAQRVPDGYTITIVGSADVLGSAERNRILSEQRAENTKSFIRSISGNKFKLETSTTSKQFDDSTPQGRFLNRSIRLAVKR